MRIVGPIYYVGTFDLASYLITTSAGHILIDSGLEKSAASDPGIHQEARVFRAIFASC